MWHRFSHEDNVIWIFHIGNLRSLQKKHRLLCQQETVSMLYLLSPICVYVSLFRCLILFKFIMTKDNSTADRQKRRRKREREKFRFLSSAFMLWFLNQIQRVHLFSSKCVRVCWLIELGHFKRTVTHGIITVLSFYLITTDQYFPNELLINHWLSIMSWSLHEKWQPITNYEYDSEWIWMHVCVSEPGVCEWCVFSLGL